MFESILWIFFILGCVVVSIVILLQEGKGGGLGEAFGGAGQQTFGVKAEGINRFTGWVSFGIIVVAVVITKIRSDSSSLEFAEPMPPTPMEQSAPAEPGSAPPAAPAGENPPQAPAPPATDPPIDGGGGR